MFVYKEDDGEPEHGLPRMEHVNEGYEDARGDALGCELLTEESIAEDERCGGDLGDVRLEEGLDVHCQSVGAMVKSP